MTTKAPLETFIVPSKHVKLWPQESNTPKEIKIFFNSGTCLTYVSVLITPSNISILTLSIPTVLHEWWSPKITIPSLTVW